MNASLVFDGTKVRIPESMGTSLPDQCQGTELEVLGEISSRICYESLGTDENGKRRGRSSVLLHEHILEVDNSSVYEHCPFTLSFSVAYPSNAYRLIVSCVNRKGTHVRYDPEGERVEITANLRAVLKWDKFNSFANTHGMGSLPGRILRHHAHKLAPQIVREGDPGVEGTFLYEHCHLKTEDLTDAQAYISLWLYGSRGFSHEQVRHRFAISQRSTRYVDEDGSPYIEHPLVSKYLADTAVPQDDRNLVYESIQSSMEEDRGTYRVLTGRLTEYCKNVLKLDATTARKQARGAARGYLGNALATEMIYTASVADWKWVLSQRKSKFADAEIRQVYTPALEALKQSQYGDRFSAFTTVPSPDGMGTVLV